MNAALGLQGIALVLAGAAFATALAAVLARSLLAMCAHLGAAGALTAAAVLLLGAGDAAIGLALFAAAWAPILLLGALLLSARSVKTGRRRLWLSALAAAVAAGVMLWPLPQLPPAPATDVSVSSGLGFWIAPLLLAAAASCVGLLGFGERGALGRGRSA